MRNVYLMILLCLLLVGCNHGDFKAEPVIKGQPAPISGYNIGPELWVTIGQPCPVTGVVIWIKGAEPNDVFGE